MNQTKDDKDFPHENEYLPIYGQNTYRQQILSLKYLECLLVSQSLHFGEQRIMSPTLATGRFWDRSVQD